MSAILRRSLSSSACCVHRAHKLQSLLAAILGLLLVEMTCENSPDDFEQHLLRQHLQAHECHSEQQSRSSIGCIHYKAHALQSLLAAILGLLLLDMISNK